MPKRVYVTKTLLYGEPDTNTRYLWVTDENGLPTERPVSVFNAERRPWTKEDEAELQWAGQLLIRELANPD